ncbi:hypothetical protein [uncultured Campylobacter sp.]|nr:hypothetical protein [uncultured Campylobacter sp.]
MQPNLNFTNGAVAILRNRPQNSKIEILRAVNLELALKFHSYKF